MLGLELEICNKKLYGAFEKGDVSILLSIVPKYDPGVLHFGGIDVSENNPDLELVDWFSQELKDGDEFTVRLVDIEESSTPISRRKRTCGLNPDEDLLREYHILKNVLEKEGLL